MNSSWEDDGKRSSWGDVMSMRSRLHWLKIIMYYIADVQSGILLTRKVV
jgi:hypothetical protein